MNSGNSICNKKLNFIFNISYLQILNNNKISNLIFGKTDNITEDKLSCSINGNKIYHFQRFY